MMHDNLYDLIFGSDGYEYDLRKGGPITVHVDKTLIDPSLKGKRKRKKYTMEDNYFHITGVGDTKFTQTGA